MTPIQLSGTPAAVRKQFEELSLPEDAQICLTVAEMTPEMKAKQENAERKRRYDEEFAEYRDSDGIIRIPSTDTLTPEQVNELMYRLEMEEVLGENWEEVAKQMQEAYEASLSSKEAEETRAA